MAQKLLKILRSILFLKNITENSLKNFNREFQPLDEIGSKGNPGSHIRKTKIVLVHSITTFLHGGIVPFRSMNTSG